jgi:hypothetical protein
MAQEPRLYTLNNVKICEACIEGKGQECHTPGCLLNLQTVPNWTKEYLQHMGVTLDQCNEEG